MIRWIIDTSPIFNKGEILMLARHILFKQSLMSLFL